MPGFVPEMSQLLANVGETRSVSVSPDAVAAASDPGASTLMVADAAPAKEDEEVIRTTTIPNMTATMGHRVVFNPYVKVSSSAPVAWDPVLEKRRRFADESRRQALALERGQRRAMTMASPISAWDVHDATRRWRRRTCKSSSSNDDEDDDSRPTSHRPRLFRLRRRRGVVGRDLDDNLR